MDLRVVDPDVWSPDAVNGNMNVRRLVVLGWVPLQISVRPRLHPEGHCCIPIR